MKKQNNWTLQMRLISQILLLFNLSKKNSKKCILTCKDALKVCEEKRASFETIGKIYLRIGNGQMQLGRLDEAIESYNKSLIEHSTDAARQSLKKAEALRKKILKKLILTKEKVLKQKKEATNSLKMESMPTRYRNIMRLLKEIQLIHQYTVIELHVTVSSWTGKEDLMTVKLVSN